MTCVAHATKSLVSDARVLPTDIRAIQCCCFSNKYDVQTVVGAFVMPNAQINPDMPLTSFAVPLEALESASGLRFFPVRGISIRGTTTCPHCDLLQDVQQSAHTGLHCGPRR